MNCDCWRSNKHQGGLNRTVGSLSRDLADTNWTKLMLAGREVNVMPDSVKCACCTKEEK